MKYQQIILAEYINKNETNLVFAKTKLDTNTVKIPTELTQLNEDILEEITTHLIGRGKDKHKSKNK